MKRAFIEGAILVALVLGLNACERDAFSSARSRPLDKGPDGGWVSGQIFDFIDAPREVAPVAPLQMTGGSGGTLVTGGPGGTFGSGGTGGTGGGATGGTGGTGGGATGGTGGSATGGSGGIGGMATGGTAGASGSY